MTMLSLEGEGGMHRQPDLPRLLVSWFQRPWWLVRGKKCIAAALSSPDESMGGWLWHGFLSHNKFHPQLPNLNEYSTDRHAKNIMHFMPFQM